MVEISSLHPDHVAWQQPVRVYLRPTTLGYDVVGIEWESTQTYVPMQ